MHPMAKRVLGPDNEPIYDLHEVFSIKGHLQVQSSRRVDLGDLNELLANIFFDDLFQFLSDR